MNSSDWYVYRYLVTGCKFSELNFSYRIGITMAARIVWHICQALWWILVPVCMAQPTEENGRLSKKILESVRRAKDGKHVGVIVPADSGSLFYNFKNYFSVVLLGICDSKYCFTFVDIGSYGKSSDSSILKTHYCGKNYTQIFSTLYQGMRYSVRTDPPCQMSSLELKLLNLQAICYIHLEERTSPRKKKFQLSSLSGTVVYWMDIWNPHK